MSALRILLIALASFMCFASPSYTQTDMPNDRQGIINWLQSKLGNMTITEVPIQETTVHCKIVDQYGAPVPGAQVQMSRKYAELPDFLTPVVEDEWQTGDSNGMARFNIKLHHENEIEWIKKKGYEPGHFTESPYYGATQEQMNELFKNSEKVPLVFTLRKLGPTTYLCHDDEFGWHIKEPSNYVIYSLLERGLKRIDRDLSKLRNPQRYDLILDATKNGNDYTVTFFPVRSNGGVQLLDQHLYEAPTAGYLPQATINISAKAKRTTYLYFISRDPGVYSRMRIEMEAWEDKLIFRYDTWTNPYGSRNLEYEPDLPADLLIKLMDEAEVALKSGKLPPEPDIPTMIASGLYK